MAEFLRVPSSSASFPLSDLGMEIDALVSEKDVKEAIAEWNANFKDPNKNLINPKNG